MSDNTQDEKEDCWEPFDYPCPVPECKEVVHGRILTGEIYVCGFPEKLCDKCIIKGYELISGDGGEDELYLNGICID